MSSFIDADGSALVGALNPSNVGQALQVDANGALIATDGVRGATLQGKVYTAYSGLINQAAGIYPLAIFNASSTRNMLIYSIRLNTGSGGVTAYLQATTVNPAFATSVTPYNRKAGSPASVALCTTTTTSQAAPGANIIDTFNSGNLTAIMDLLTNGQVYVLPANANNGLTLFLQTFAAGLSSLSIGWIEF